MNMWIDHNNKKRIKRDLALIVDEALEDDGYYGGMEAGEITDEEAERTYQVCLQVILRVAKYIGDGCQRN